MGRVKGSIVNDRTVKAEELRETLKPIHEKLRAHGVKDEDLPSNEYLVGKLTELIDKNAVEKLAQDYSEWVKKKP